MAPSAGNLPLPRLGPWLAVAGVVGAIAVVGRDALRPDLAPWGSDTWGHLTHALHLREAWAAGDPLPRLFAGWYLGIQNLRYWGPLTYLLLAGALALGCSPLQAANLFVVATMLLGALGVLRFRRWWGWPLASAAAVLFVVLPDHLRVAFAEGNLPRALCNALLPWLIYFTIRVLETPAARWPRLCLALTFALVVLTHAMMAAIFGVGLALIAVLAGVLGGASARSVGLTLGLLALGTLLAGWWFLPSLQGGITALDPTAAQESLVFVAPTLLLDPLRRWRDPEVLYLGLSLVLLLPLFWRLARQPTTRALLLSGVLTAVVVLEPLRPLYLALPGHTLFWPQRFLSVGVTALLLGGCAALAEGGRRRRWLLVGALTLLVVDTLPSLHLARLRPPPAELAALSSAIGAAPGWREATLDRSRLGSAPAFYISAQARREQIFGWAYQGAATARLISALNWALEHGWTAYALSRLDLLGVDDALVDRRSMPPSTEQMLRAGGFALAEQRASLAWWHRDGAPRAWLLRPQALGIGRGAHNLAVLFPSLLVGSSPVLDDYSPAFLHRFPVLVLSGFQWRDRQRAEQLVRDYALQGGHVVVDLTGAPLDPLARSPYFLGVYGEPVWLSGRLQAQIDGQPRDLGALSSAYQPWLGIAPQGLDGVASTFDYLEQAPALVGWRTVQGRDGQTTARVWFVGANLPFHALVARHPGALQVLAQALRLQPEALPTPQRLPLQRYLAHTAGYHLELELPRAGLVLLPVAMQDGLRIWLDGQPITPISLEELVVADLPAGRHVVELRIASTAIHRLGGLASLLGLAGLAWTLQRRRGSVGHVQPAPDDAWPFAALDLATEASHDH